MGRGISISWARPCTTRPAPRAAPAAIVGCSGGDASSCAANARRRATRDSRARVPSLASPGPPSTASRDGSSSQAGRRGIWQVDVEFPPSPPPASSASSSSCERYLPAGPSCSPPSASPFHYLPGARPPSSCLVRLPSPRPPRSTHALLVLVRPTWRPTRVRPSSPCPPPALELPNSSTAAAVRSSGTCRLAVWTNHAPPQRRTPVHPLPFSTSRVGSLEARRRTALLPRPGHPISGGQSGKGINSTRPVVAIIVQKCHQGPGLDWTGPAGVDPGPVCWRRQRRLLLPWLNARNCPARPFRRPPPATTSSRRAFMRPGALARRTSAAPPAPGARCSGGCPCPPLRSVPFPSSSTPDRTFVGRHSPFSFPRDRR